MRVFHGGRRSCPECLVSPALTSEATMQLVPLTSFLATSLPFKDVHVEGTGTSEIDDPVTILLSMRKGLYASEVQ